MFRNNDQNSHDLDEFVLHLIQKGNLKNLTTGIVREKVIKILKERRKAVRKGLHYNGEVFFLF